jgi:hypothetical protein
MPSTAQTVKRIDTFQRLCRQYKCEKHYCVLCNQHCEIGDLEHVCVQCLSDCVREHSLMLPAFWVPELFEIFFRFKGLGRETTTMFQGRGLHTYE